MSDVDVLFRTIEDVHPDLYAHRPRDSVIAARGRLSLHFPHRSREPCFGCGSLLSWRRLASIAMPREEARRMQAEGALVFPPSVSRDDAGRVIISAAPVREPDLQDGDRLVSLNGLSADSLLRVWIDETSGESDRFRAAQVTS